MGVLGAPCAYCVEVFQSHADGIDPAMAAGTLRFFLVGLQTLFGCEQPASEARDLRNVGGCGRWRIVQQFAQYPGTALDRAGFFAVTTHQADGGHA